MKVYKIFDRNFNEVHSGTKQSCIESFKLWHYNRILYEWAYPNYPIAIYEFDFEPSEDCSNFVKVTKVDSTECSQD